MVYPSVQARLLIQLEQLEIEAKAVHDNIMKSTDWFQYVDPQNSVQGAPKILVKTQMHDIERTACATKLVPKAGMDDVGDLGVRGETVFANLTS